MCNLKFGTNMLKLAAIYYYAGFRGLPDTEVLNRDPL